MKAKTRAENGSLGESALVTRIAERFVIDPEHLFDILKATAFKQTGDKGITNEQMTALLVVADQYGLNPFTREIYAFPDKKGGIVPVVGVDGWNRIANEHPAFDGVEFAYSDDIVMMEGAQAPCHAWIETVLYRKDRNHPVRVREYLDECYRPPFIDRNTGYVTLGPWQTHPKRFLRHKAEIQCYRVGFAFVGIYDEDEAYRIIEGENARSDADPKPSATVVVPITATGSRGITRQATQHVSPATFNRKETDAFVARLVSRARASNQWEAAKELVRERLTGTAAAYALAELGKAQPAAAPDASLDPAGATEPTEQPPGPVAETESVPEQASFV